MEIESGSDYFPEKEDDENDWEFTNESITLDKEISSDEERTSVKKTTKSTDKSEIEIEENPDENDPNEDEETDWIIPDIEIDDDSLIKGKFNTRKCNYAPKKEWKDPPRLVK